MSGGISRRRYNPSGFPGGGRSPDEDVRHWVVGAKGQTELVTDLPNGVRAIERQLRDAYDGARLNEPRSNTKVRPSGTVHRYLCSATSFDSRPIFSIVDNNRIIKSVRSDPSLDTQILAGMIMERLIDVDILKVYRQWGDGTQADLLLNWGELDAWVASALLYLEP